MDEQRFRALERRVQDITRPDDALFSYYLVTSVLGVVTLPALIPLWFRFHSLRYRFEGDGISVEEGVLFKRTTHLTYARIQDIHLSQNLLERWLGIGSVKVQTAGGGTSGDVDIVGIKAFEPVRDYLYARLRGVREGRPLEATALATGTDPEAVLLTEIRDALQGAAAALASRGDKGQP